MKVVVFAHTPPPHHGQSYMVQLMLKGFGGDKRNRRRKAATLHHSPDTPARGLSSPGGSATHSPSNPGMSHAPEGSRAQITATRPDAPLPNPMATPDGDYGIDCYHVNARLSIDLEDIGGVRPGKFFLLFGYCLQAIWCRFRYGATILYYVPAPGKKVALYRDWLVMRLCRPFFKKIILHWHAAGLAKWLETAVQIRTRSVTYRLMKAADLSIVLSEHGQVDAQKLEAKRIAVVTNGVPHPCPDFYKDVLPRRLARVIARKRLLAGQDLTSVDLTDTARDPHIFKVLYLAHCTRQKGLFDTLDGVALANQRLVELQSAVRVQLFVAGTFIEPAEKAEFEKRVAQPDFKTITVRSGDLRPADSGQSRELWTAVVHYKGFVSGEEKNRLFAECDCFCFPTYFGAESFGLVLVEAMAFGLPIVTTLWRAIPELLPEGYPDLVEIRAPNQIASALLDAMTLDSFSSLHEHFVEHFTLEKHLANLAASLLSVE